MIEYAVVHLKVQHIVLCGHTSCGAAGAALSDSRVGGVLDTWLTPLKAVRKANEAELKGIKDAAAKAVRLAEMNIKMGVDTLLSNYVVEEAVTKRGLLVHGVIYDIAQGKIRNLKIGNPSKPVIGGGPRQEYEIVKGNHAMLRFKGDEAEMVIR